MAPHGIRECSHHWFRYWFVTFWCQTTTCVALMVYYQLDNRELDNREEHLNQNSIGFIQDKGIWNCYPVCSGLNDLMPQPYYRQLAIRITHVPERYNFCDSPWKSSFSSHTREYVPCIIGSCSEEKWIAINLSQHLHFQIHCPVHWNFFDRTVWPKYKISSFRWHCSYEACLFSVKRDSI